MLLWAVQARRLIAALGPTLLEALSRVDVHVVPTCVTPNLVTFQLRVTLAYALVEITHLLHLCNLSFYHRLIISTPLSVL